MRAAGRRFGHAAPGMRFLPGDFEVLTSTSGDTATLTLRGELDMATVDAVEQAIAAVGDAPRPLVIDLRGLRFLDSMGLELFLALDTRLREAGRELVLVRGPRAVHRLFAGHAARVGAADRRRAARLSRAAHRRLPFRSPHGERLDVGRASALSPA